MGWPLLSALGREGEDYSFFSLPALRLGPELASFCEYQVYYFPHEYNSIQSMVVSCRLVSFSRVGLLQLLTKTWICAQALSLLWQVDR